MAHHHSRVLIIGSGPAGYTAAIYAARANLKPLLVAGLVPGGQLTITTDVENYPGFAEPIQGPWLMQQMQAQAEAVGTRIVQDIVAQVDLSARPFQAKSDAGDTFSGDTVIIATGAQARWLGLDSETRLQGAGVSACATCDGFFFRDKEIAVVGGGNTAVEEALFLTNFGTKVTLIHRRDALRADKIMQDRLLRHEKIEMAWDSIVEEILDNGAAVGEPPAVTGVRVRNVKTGSVREIAAEGVFIAIGHDPASGLFKGQLDMDENGYIRTAPDSTATNIPGVYAAGDVKDRIYRQAVTAAGMGCMAAIEAEKFLAEQGDEESRAADSTARPSANTARRDGDRDRAPGGASFDWSRGAPGVHCPPAVRVTGAARTPTPRATTTRLRRCQMATYIILANYTDQGIRDVKQSPKRLDAARELARKLGAEIKDFYLTVGAHDIVLTLDAPDDKTVARFALAVGAQGNVRTTTLKAFTEAEFRDIVQGLP